MEKHYTTEKLINLTFQGIEDYSIRSFAQFLAVKENEGAAKELLTRVAWDKAVYKAIAYEGRSYVAVFHHQENKQDYILQAKNELDAMSAVATLYYGSFD